MYTLSFEELPLEWQTKIAELNEQANRTIWQGDPNEVHFVISPDYLRPSVTPPPYEVLKPSRVYFRRERGNRFVFDRFERETL